MAKFTARILRKRAANMLKQAFNPGIIFAYWHVNDVNWGDGLNPVLIRHLSGKVPHFTDDPYTRKQMVVGSILHLADKNTVVWGAGFISDGLKTKDKPKAVHAVRGPLTRRQLLKNGIDAPEVYGDPALLLPSFFNPDVPKKYDVGIIPHYVDKTHPWVSRHSNDPKVLIIDVQAGHESFVEAIKSCNVILSSSLHGVICADAYNVPSLWVEFSDKVVGGGFKFFDYFESVQRDRSPAIRISESDPMTQVLSYLKDYKIQFDKSRLLHACPFLSEAVKARLGIGSPAAL